MQTLFPTALQRITPAIAAGHLGKMMDPALVNKLMALQKQHTDKKHADRAFNAQYMPHIRNALINVPEEDLARLKLVTDSLRAAMHDMYLNVVRNIGAYIKNTKSPDQWANNPVLVDYVAGEPQDMSGLDDKNTLSASALNRQRFQSGINYISADLADLLVERRGNSLAYDKNELLALIKLLTFFAIAINTKQVSPQLASKVATWYNQSQLLFDEIKLAKRSYKLFDPSRLKAGKLMPNQEEILKSAMRDARKALRDPKVQTQLGTSANYRSQYKRLLDNLFKYFFSESAPGYDFIVNNIGILEDPDLNAILTPKFSGDVGDELKNLTTMVKRHGGSGLHLTEQQENVLKERNPDAHKSYRKQYLLINNARKLAMRALIRASGQKLMDASKVKAELIKQGLPVNFIPTGFEKGGKYDEHGNMYDPKGVQFNINPVGGWLRWREGDGSDAEFMAEYQNPNMEKPSGVQSMQWVKGGLQDKKRGHVEHNEAKLAEFGNKWIADSQSNNPQTRMLGFLAQLLYYTGMRVGGGKTKGVQTYGLTSLQVGHVKRYIDPDGERGLNLEFVGKSGVPHKLKLAPNNATLRRLIKYIESQTVGKKRSDRLWRIGTRATSISPGTINAYLQGHGWAGSAKTFRTLRGNVAFKRELADEPSRFNSRQNAIAYLEDKIKKVGEELGHKRANKEGKMETTFLTAAKSYIDPHLIISFLNRHNVNPKPSWAERLEYEADKDDDGED